MREFLHINSSKQPDEETDPDVCDENEISRLFQNAFPSTEQQIGSNKNYILNISATLNNSPNIALTLSDNTCQVHSLNNTNLSKLSTFEQHTDTVVDVKFSSDDNNLVYTGSNDGSIKLWDIRTPKKHCMEFLDTSDDTTRKRFSCFDVSNNNRLVAAGTELFEAEAFVLFWDIRGTSFLGGYWESHTDDITQVRFHPSDPNKLISGSTDGLINVYNLLEECEDDALVDSLNTESSVEVLQWSTSRGNDVVSCITHTADLQLWKLENAEPFLHLRRQDIGEAIKKKSGDSTCVVNVHSTQLRSFLLAGSNADDGKCLRSIVIDNSRSKPAINFQNNRQIVRSSWFNANINLLLTGGEEGILNVWKISSSGVDGSL